MEHTSQEYLLSNQPTELERLQLQSRVWEPAGRQLLKEISPFSSPRVLDLGCGAMGWLRVLSEWAGAEGKVIGSDIDDRLLSSAREFIESQNLRNVELVKDDLFNSRLEPGSFDLLHSRFQIAPLGRANEQIAVYRRLVKQGGWIVIEDPDISSWRVNPRSPAVERLIELIDDGFRQGGREFQFRTRIAGVAENNWK